MQRRAIRFPVPPPDSTSIYVRLSHAADDKNTSKDGMIAECRELLVREGLREVALHVDDGLSGAIRNRPEFVGWLDDAREGRAANLVAWHVDRMTREGVNVAAALLDLIEGKDPITGRVVRQGIRLLDTKGLDSAGDEQTFRWKFVLAAEIAREERKRIQDRQKAKYARLKAAGRWPGGPAPYGFMIVENPDGPGKVLAVNPVEAAALREAAEMFLAGRSKAAVTRWMNRHAPKPRRAAAWSRVTLQQSLMTESAAALIWSPAERRTLARVLAVKPDPKKGGRKPSRLLTGVLICHACEHRLQVARYAHRETPSAVTYRCTSQGDGRDCERPVMATAELIENAVSAAWLDGWGRIPETITVRASDERDDWIAELEEAIEEEGALVVKARGAERVEALTRLESLEAKRDELLAQPTSTLTTIRETGRTYADAWNLGDVDDRRELLLRTAGPLTLLPGKRGGRRIPGYFDMSRIADAWKLDPAQADAVIGEELAEATA